MNTATNIQPYHDTQARHHNSIGYAAPDHTFDEPVASAEFSGLFSLIDNAPVHIRVEPGLVVRVHGGAVWAYESGREDRRRIHAGQQFVCERSGVLTISEGRHAELRIDR